jgi:uncharacterized protein involved in exopolysaccharide biosynthesis
MKNNSELVRLEEFVDNLLTKYKTLQKIHRALESTLEEKEAECARLKDTIAELRSERTEVGNRVSGLLERIERWEENLAAGEAEMAGKEEQPAEGLQGNLFKKERAAAK